MVMTWRQKGVDPSPEPMLIEFRDAKKHAKLQWVKEYLPAFQEYVLILNIVSETSTSFPCKNIFPGFNPFFSKQEYASC